MSSLIYQLPTPIPATGGVLPGFKFMTCGDNLATLTTPGYLNQVNLQTFPVSNSDVLQVLYDYSVVSNTGTYGVFLVSIDSVSGLITLSAWKDTTNTVLLSVFTLGSPTTVPYTVPANTLYITYYIVGGGGGGGGFVDGGGVNTFGAGGGGGAGSFAQGVWTVGSGGPNQIPSLSFNVTVTSGGAGGVGSAAGATGGTVVLTYPSPIPSTTVTGGSGGAGATGVADTAALFTAGGIGGLGIIGGGLQYVGRGMQGGNGLSVLGQVASGVGGNSNYNSGGVSRVNSNGAGFPGSFAGTGGSGACGLSAGSLTGGAGSNPFVLFSSFGIGP